MSTETGEGTNVDILKIAAEHGWKVVPHKEDMSSSRRYTLEVASHHDNKKFYEVFLSLYNFGKGEGDTVASIALELFDNWQYAYTLTNSFRLPPEVKYSDKGRGARLIEPSEKVGVTNEEVEAAVLLLVGVAENVTLGLQVLDALVRGDKTRAEKLVKKK
jgi:hypothetical protein